MIYFFDGATNKSLLYFKEDIQWVFKSIDILVFTFESFPKGAALEKLIPMTTMKKTMAKIFNIFLRWSEFYEWIDEGMVVMLK